MCQLKNVVLHIWYYSKCIQHERHIISKSSDLETKQSLWKSTSTYGINFLIRMSYCNKFSVILVAGNYIIQNSAPSTILWCQWKMIQNLSSAIYHHVVFVTSEYFSDTQILGAIVKGQLISKCLLGVVVSTKKPTNFF